VLLPPGATFDRYVIEGLLGEGGMGRVYSAYDPRLDRRVALKVLLAPHETRDGAATDGRTLDSEGSARLLREARAAAALDHPNAVSVFDVGEVGGVAFIAMELLEGRSLRTYVGDASLPVEQRLRWLVDVAHALGAAHHRGLVHRDIKPENVMIRGDGVAKVLDFGIARRIELQAVVGPVTPPDAARVATAPGTLVGTPLYMAPEQIRGDPVDGRTDQFAWGVVAFELLTGAPPWDTGGSGLRLVADILSKPAPELGSSEVSPAVEAAIRKALSKAPGDRFASMEELADAIAPRVTRPPHEPIAVDSRRSPLPPSLATTAPTPRPRRLLRVLGIMATAGALLVAVAWPSRHPARHAEETSTGTTSAPAAPPASSAAKPRAIPDAPPPRTLVPQAGLAYQAALESLRDASIMSAVTSLHRAVELDPALGAAHLRLAWLSATQGDLPAARAELRLARDLRGALDARDQAVLATVEAHVLAQPPAPAAAFHLAGEASAAWPDDAELAFLAGRYALLAGEGASALGSLDRALTLDPRFALVWWARAIEAEDRGDVDAALAAYDACVALSPGAASCLRSRAVHAAQRGECARVEQDARRLVSIEPDGPRAYEFLARALAALDRPVDAVRSALEQQWRLLPPARRPSVELADRARLAMLQGDFASAEASAVALRDLVRGARAEIEHAAPVVLLLDAYSETGDAARAGATADEFRRERDAWIATRPLGDTSLSGTTPRILAAARRAGRMTQADYESARADWLREAEASLPSSWRRELWVPAFAVPAESPEEARAALYALPAYEPLPPPRDLTMVDAAVGKVHALAGSTPDALPYLRRAAATCLVLDDPVAHVRAQLALGEALEATDAQAACAAYAAVIARWGQARPRSKTADEARARWHAARCAR